MTEVERLLAEIESETGFPVRLGGVGTVRGKDVYVFLQYSPASNPKAKFEFGVITICEGKRRYFVGLCHPSAARIASDEELCQVALLEAGCADSQTRVRRSIRRGTKIREIQVDEKEMSDVGKRSRPQHAGGARCST